MADVPKRSDSHGVVVVSGGVRFAVYVQPRASRSEVVGMHGDAFKIRLAAPPVEGAANEALVELLARKRRAEPEESGGCGGRECGGSAAKARGSS
jgi:uncharacterized protein (TIGR00251 family)